MEDAGVEGETAWELAHALDFMADKDLWDIQVRNSSKGSLITFFQIYFVVCTVYVGVRLTEEYWLGEADCSSLEAAKGFCDEAGKKTR